MIIELFSALWFGILTSISPCPLATNIAAVSFLSKKVNHPKNVLLLSFSYILYSSCIAAVVLASGRTLPYTIGTAVACLVSLLVCWFLVPITALGGMVYAHVVYVSIIFVIVHFHYLRKIFDVSPVEQITRVFFPPLIAGICMVFCIRYLLTLLNMTSSYLNIGVGVVAGTLLYSAVILLTYIKPMDIKSIFNRIIVR